MSGLRRPSVAGVVAVLAAAALAACGGDPEPQEGFGAAKLQTATCDGWRDASPQEREAVVDRLEEEVAGPHGEGTTLPDDVAYSTLEARCQPEFAGGFLLYELYIRAAAFSSLAE